MNYSTDVMNALLSMLTVFSMSLSGCKNPDQMVTIKDVSRDTTFVIQPTNSLFEQEVLIEVAGQLDGTAVLETSHTIVNKSEPTTVLTCGYFINTDKPKKYIKEDVGLKHTVRYKSITAKKGELVLTIKLPADPTIPNTPTDYVSASNPISLSR